MPLAYHIIYPLLILMGWIVRLWGRWHIRGKENVPKKGPIIVIANHVNTADVPLLIVSLGRKVAFMAKEELFRSKLSGFLLQILGTFPVHRERIDIKAIRRAQQLLAKGGVLIVFPEGSRSSNAQLQSAFSGATLIAVRSGAPILPVGISGTEKLTGLASALHHPPQITINFGRTFFLPPINGENNRLTKEKRSEFTHLLMQRIAELLPPEYHGNYAGKESRRHED